MNHPPSPYGFLPVVPKFDVISHDIKDSEVLPTAQVSGIMGAGGEDISPHLSWSGAPNDTESYVVTCFDPDAPTGSGFWHWVVYDIPPSITELATGAGKEASTVLPKGSKHLKNDAGFPGYLGSAPPPGHGPHRYIFAVHALNIEVLPINEHVSAAVCGFNMFGKTVGRAIITPIYEQI